MTYVISDIHGCYNQYINMLNYINFTDADTLYVLGDAVNRGSNSIKVLQDMRSRENVIPIIGNHDALTLDILSSLSMDITPDSLTSYLDQILPEFASYLDAWFNIGGKPTLQEYIQLPYIEREHILDYLSAFNSHKIVSINNNTYVLTHAGIPPSARHKKLHRYKLASYDLLDWLQSYSDYTKQYFTDAFLVTGHIPTYCICEQSRGKIYRHLNHIAIDTGAVFGEVMGCLCLDSDKEFYLP